VISFDVPFEEERRGNNLKWRKTKNARIVGFIMFKNGSLPDFLSRKYDVITHVAVCQPMYVCFLNMIFFLLV
jgi:hypothetical protein